MHYVYFVKYGLNKPRANDMEEAICTAASLITLYNLYPERFESYNDYVQKLEYNGYRKGAKVATDIKYSMTALKELI